MTTDDSGDSTSSDEAVDAARTPPESVDYDSVIEAVVERLSSVPGLRMDVKSSKGRVRNVIGDIPFVNDLHRPSHPIRGLTVTVGTVDYWMEPTSGQPWCGIDTVTVSRGRTTENVELATWTSLLFEDVIRHHHLDPGSAAALRGLVHGERV